MEIFVSCRLGGGGARGPGAVGGLAAGDLRGGGEAASHRRRRHRILHQRQQLQVWISISLRICFYSPDLFVASRNTANSLNSSGLFGRGLATSSVSSLVRLALSTNFPGALLNQVREMELHGVRRV